MKEYVNTFLHYRFLLKELVKKGIKLKYRRSYLGIVWSLLEPLLTMMVLTIVFGTLFGNKDKTFPVYILTGRLMYSYFSSSTTRALKSVRANAGMIKKVYVPKYIYQDGSTEKTDIDINVGKQELAVKVNGKDFGIKKADNEKYVFDKYKLQLNQTSRSDLNITVPVIDKTKRWEIGIGASKDGAVGMVGFPVKGNIGGWIAGRQGNVMAGVMVKI